MWNHSDPISDAIRPFPYRHDSDNGDDSVDDSPSIYTPPYGYKIVAVPRGVTSVIESALENTICIGAEDGGGWMLFAIIANAMGYSTKTVEFFLLTGLGDSLGVTAGYIAYSGVKYAAIKGLQWCGRRNLDTPDLKAELIRGVFFGLASYPSGFMYQPSENLGLYLNLSFLGTAMVTGVGCGISFFIGLQLATLLFRRAFGQTEVISDYSWANLVEQLKMAFGNIGGNLLFVGTDSVNFNNAVTKVFGATGGIGQNVGVAMASSMLGTCGFRLVFDYIFNKVGDWWCPINFRYQEESPATPTVYGTAYLHPSPATPSRWSRCCSSVNNGLANLCSKFSWSRKTSTPAVTVSQQEIDDANFDAAYARASQYNTPMSRFT